MYAETGIFERGITVVLFDVVVDPRSDTLGGGHTEHPACVGIVGSESTMISVKAYASNNGV